LPRNTYTSSFTIERLDDPRREINIDTFLFLVDATGARKIKIITEPEAPVVDLGTLGTQQYAIDRMLKTPGTPEAGV
jgi:hypothetical protein